LSNIGDARYKWPAYIQDTVLPFLFPSKRRLIPPNYHTPPYITAAPEVTHYQRDASDQFLIMATDGLWDEISSETSVGIVAELVKKQFSGNFATSLIKAALSDIDYSGNLEDMDRIQHHLSIQPPQSRRFRDDITVNVCIFDDIVPNTSSIEVPEVPTFESQDGPQLHKYVKSLQNKTYPKL
jgi:pyruvate dehydrogenase phosphatase